jgi:hypothetical protein
MMKSFLFAGQEVRRSFPAVSLDRSVVLFWTALVVLSGPVVARALGASEFSPLPKRTEVALSKPIILVSTNRLNFGSVPVGKWATNTVLVQNIGGGTLMGKASVQAPFKIISGGVYALTDADIQVVTFGPRDCDLHRGGWR